MNPPEPAWTDTVAKIGGTPLAPAPTLARALHIPNLFLKDETRNPGGASVARLVASQIKIAAAERHTALTLATVGPEAAVWARLAKTAKIGCNLYAPSTAETAWLKLAEGQGARVQRVDRDLEEIVEESRAAAAANGWYDANPAFKNRSQRFDAYASLADELVAPPVPAVIAAPTRNGTTVAALGDRFERLQSAGRLPASPRLIASTTKMGNPIVWSLASQHEECVDLEPQAVWPSATSEPLAVAHAADGDAAMAAIRASGGWAYAASDAELEALAHDLETKESIRVLPASTAGIAALRFAAGMDRLDANDIHIAVLSWAPRPT